MLKDIDLKNKCGSCEHFKPMGDMANGECLQNPYDDTVVHDPKHPHWIVQRSRIKCPLYNVNPKTNADRIRAMSDEELAKEMLFFCPSDTLFKGGDTYEKPHYTGLDGNYYATSEEVISKNIEWLKQPAEMGE